MARFTVIIFALFSVWSFTEALNCYQQTYVPGLINTLTNTNPLTNPNMNTQQQMQQQQYANYAQAPLPSITCSNTATSCFKFTCFGPTSYAIKGCLDYAQPSFSCQAMDAQCLGGNGNCYLCNGNNCNGAFSINAGSVKLIVALIGAFFVIYFN